MASIGKAILLGFLIWLVPFVVAVAIFPIRESWRALFESIMPVTLTAVVVLCSLLYFRKVHSQFFKEGVLLGVIWFGLSVLIDLPLFSAGPMEMSFLEYFGDIGLTYLIIPLITTGIGAALAWKKV